MASHESLWNQYRDEAAVSRAEHFAKYTAPALMVDSLDKVGREQASVEHDFQSVGALLLNNLAAKLTSLLFPSNQPFFKNAVTDELKQAATRQGVADTALASTLSLLEQEATKNLFLNASFAKLTRAIKLLLVTGQVLLYRDPVNRKFRVWSMHNFAVRRDAYGEWVCIILKQKMKLRDVGAEAMQAFLAKNPGMKPDQDIFLLTKIERTERAAGKVVVVTSQIDGKAVGDRAQYPEHLCPWVLPIWGLADGEQYARGMVEEYSGDFSKLSILSEQLGLYELDSLQVLNLVDEASGSVVDDVQSAEPGDYIPGKNGSITAYETGSYQKMDSVRQSLAEVVSRLSVAFMYTGNTRDAERVTAEEIRAQAKEAETMLGGAYSVLAETLQTPLAYLMMSEVSPDTLVGLVSKTFYPQIITGIPALNRNVEVQNLVAATQEAAVVVPALIQLDNRIDPQKLMDLFYRNRSVDVTSLFKSEDTLRKEAATKASMADAQAQLTAGIVDPNLQTM